MRVGVTKKDYHKKVKAVSGPLYSSFQVKKGRAEVVFTHVGSGLMVGYKDLLKETVLVNEPLKWFEIMDEDGEWKAAEAKIISKNKVAIWNVLVSNPINVRYAWSGNPEGANLYNKEGLPASVFSTER